MKETLERHAQCACPTLNTSALFRKDREQIYLFSRTARAYEHYRDKCLVHPRRTAGFHSKRERSAQAASVAEASSTFETTLALIQDQARGVAPSY